MDGLNSLLFFLDLFFEASQFLFPLGHATLHSLEVIFRIPQACAEQNRKKDRNPQDL